MRNVLIWIATLLLCFGHGAATVAQQNESKQTPTIDQRALVQYKTDQNEFQAIGDKATLFYKGSATAVSVVLGGDVIKMNQLPDTDIWFASKTFPDLQKGIASYYFVVTHMDGIKAPPGKKTQNDKPAVKFWRGPNSPAPLQYSKKLKGTIQEFELKSVHLEAQRKVTVYRPPGTNKPNTRLPVIYMADGSSVKEYALAIEPLICDGTIARTIIIGVHSGGYVGEFPADLSQYDADKDLRAAEYLPMLKSAHFPKHENFFCKEVITWAEREFSIASDRENRILFGVSNGARFAATMGVRHPDIFGHVIALSVAGGVAPQFKNEPKAKSSFHFAAGTWEPGFHRLTKEFHDAVKKADCPSRFRSRVTGHDPRMWQEEFSRTVQYVLGTSAR